MSRLDRLQPIDPRSLSARPPAARRWALLRVQAGLTQRQVSEATGITPPELSRIEHGSELAGPDRRFRLAVAYGIDPYDMDDEA